jgi:hypothetical protein
MESLEFVDAFIVDAGRTSVGLDLLVRLPHTVRFAMP